MARCKHAADAANARAAEDKAAAEKCRAYAISADRRRAAWVADSLAAHKAAQAAERTV